MSGRKISDLAKSLMLEPEEDSGSDTASRYNFQYQCAARHCLSLLEDTELTGIVCEWHVDYVLIYSDGSQELVSVKHREPNVGPWSFAELWTSGGLATLYQRWKTDPTIRCRLTTNAGLKSQRDSAFKFSLALTKQHVDDYVKEASEKLGCEDGQAKSFLLNLRIESGIPDRVAMRAYEIVETVEPALNRLNINHITPAKAWDSIVDLVARASRDLDNRIFSATDFGNSSALDVETLTSGRVNRRTVRRSDVIRALSPIENIQRTTISNLWLREPVQNFTGRNEVFEEITEFLRTDITHHSGLALIGMSGVGKSEVLAQYAAQLHGTDYKFIWWVRADSWNSLITDLASLAEKLGLTTPDSEGGIQEMKQYFRENAGLILLDGPTADRAVVNLIPKDASTRFLIASLDQGWAAHFPIIRLSPLEDEDAVELLGGILTSTPKEDLHSLNQALNGLPLALKQAAGYISTSGISADTYSRMVRERAKELLHRSAPPEHIGLTAALALTMERLQSSHPLALELLGVLSYLSPTAFPTELFAIELPELGQEGRPVEAFIPALLQMEELAFIELTSIAGNAVRLLDLLRDQISLFDALADLQKFSLIDTHQENVSCHALTQAVVRRSLTGDQRKASIETGAVLLNKVARINPYDSRHWPHYRHMMPHFETLIEHLEANHLLAVTALKLQASMSMSLGVQGMRESCLTYAQTAMETLRRVGTQTPAILAYVQIVLIEALTGADQWTEALRVADEGLADALMNELDPIAIAVLHTKRAGVLQLQGKLQGVITEFDKAQSCLEEGSDRRDSHRLWIAIEANRATMRREIGDAKGAVKDFEKLISEYDSTDSPNGLATLYSNLSLAHLEALQFAEALHSAQQALEISSQSSNGLHLDASRDWNNAGLALLELGRPEEASEAFMASLHIHERLSASMSSFHLIVKVNLGRSQLAKGDFPAACKTLEAALADQERIVGTSHRDVASTLANLTAAYTARRQYGNAIKAASRAIEIDLTVYGENHPELIPDYHNMASALMMAGSHRAALKWLAKALRISNMNFGPGSLRSGACLSKIAVCEYEDGNRRKAIEIMTRAVSVVQSALGPTHPERLACEDFLIRMQKGKSLKLP